MQLRATFVMAALTLGACAGGKGELTPEHDPYFTLPLVASTPPVVAPEADVVQTEAFAVQISVEKADGSRLGAPQISVYPGQVANVSVGSSLRTDVVTGGGQEVDDGLRMEACVQRAADGGTTVAYRFVLAKAREGGVQVERVDVSGARWMEAGVIGMLARVTSPDGSGPLLVLARVTPIRVPAPPAGATEGFGTAALARPMSGHTLHLRISAAQVSREFEPGTVVDETAAPDVLKSIGGRVLHDFEVYSCLDSRVRLAGVVEADGKVRGLVAQGRDDGKLDLSWTTTGDAHTATIRPNQGRRFVAIARAEGGGTAGAIVSVDADD